MQVKRFTIALGLMSILGASWTPEEPPMASREAESAPDPTWMRLGLPESPTPESGQGVGIVLLDDTGLHPALRPLGGRLRHLVVDRDQNVSIVEPLLDARLDERAEFTHGVEALLQMAAAPFAARGRTYGGLAQGSSYFVVPYLAEQRIDGDGDHPRSDPRLDRAIEWVVENRARWNIRVILLETWFEYRPLPPGDPARDGLIKNTRKYPIVRALEPAVRAGILVITGNGNTSTENNGPPVEYLAVGAYHDSGHADPRWHRENPDEPWGRNSDGHARPDLLAPKYFVPNHLAPDGQLATFGGTSSASAQVAGLCGFLFAKHPDADAETVKQALIRSGDPLPNSRRPGVRVNAARALQALADRSVKPPWPRVSPPIQVNDPDASLRSPDPVERALAVSAIAWHPERFRPNTGDDPRPIFWRLLGDESPTVRKAAGAALGPPRSVEDRRRIWEALRQEKDMGVRGQWVCLLLGGAGADPVDPWVALANDPNWTVRWSVAKILRDHHPDAPRLEFTFLPDEVEARAAPIFDWSRGRKPPR